MALDYDNRTDYRAFDIMVRALNNASLEQMRKAHKMCKKMSNNMGKKASHRIIWKRFATLVNPLTKN